MPIVSETQSQAGTRMKLFGWGTLGLATVAGVGFFYFTMPVMDRRMNRMVRVLQEPVSTAARSLQPTLTVADLHADPLFWPRNLDEWNRNGQVDLPRLARGGVAVQVFGVVTQVPKNLNPRRNAGNPDLARVAAIASRWPPRTWSSRVERALYQADRFDRAVLASRERLVPIRSRSDLTRLLAERGARPERVGGVLALDGGQAAEGSLRNLDRLYDAGYRIIGLTAFADNELGGSSSGIRKRGLTPFGRRALEWMERRRVIVDLAHASPPLLADVLSMVRRPVMVSHTGVRALCPRPTNLSDGELAAVGQAGGLIGIEFSEAAACGLEPDTIAAAIRHAVDLVGVRQVALGSNFDAATTTSFDARDYILVTDALIRHRFAADEIRLIMGGNVVRFLMDYLPPT